jgi:hypothetical protein
MRVINILLIFVCLTGSGFISEKTTPGTLHLTWTDPCTLQHEFGAWRTTSCFRGLDYCVKRTEYNEYSRKYEWHVKFKNRYVENITINCVLAASDVSAATTTDRVTVRAGEETTLWFLVPDANSVNVFIDKARFGNDDWGTPYAKCDNQ